METHIFWIKYEKIIGEENKNKEEEDGGKEAIQ